MTRGLVAAALLVLCTGVSSAQAKTSPVGALKAVRDARPVRVTQSVRLWKNGKWIATNEAVLLRVEVANPYDFAPRDAAPLQFVYGKSICQIVVSPLIDGVAVLLAAPLDPGDASAVTVIPGIALKKLDERTMSAIAKRPGLVVPIIDASATRTTYPSLESLRREAMKAVGPRS